MVLAFRFNDRGGIPLLIIIVCEALGGAGGLWSGFAMPFARESSKTSRVGLARRERRGLGKVPCRENGVAGEHFSGYAAARCWRSSGWSLLCTDHGVCPRRVEAVGLVIEVVRDRGLHLALQDVLVVLVWVPATLDSDAIRDEVVLEVHEVHGVRSFAG